MAERVEESMAKSLESWNNRTQEVREEIIIKQTKNSSNSSPLSTNLLNKRTNLKLDCNRLSVTVLVKRLLKIKDKKLRHKFSQRWLKECASETLLNKDAKSHIKYFG